MDNNKTYRVRTNVGSDTVVHFQATRDIDFLEILSLKMRNSNNYKTMTSDTGVVVGRVMARNPKFGRLFGPCGVLSYWVDKLSA